MTYFSDGSGMQDVCENQSGSSSSRYESPSGLWGEIVEGATEQDYLMQTRTQTQHFTTNGKSSHTAGQEL